MSMQQNARSSRTNNDSAVNAVGEALGDAFSSSAFARAARQQKTNPKQQPEREIFGSVMRTDAPPTGFQPQTTSLSAFQHRRGVVLAPPSSARQLHQMPSNNTQREVMPGATRMQPAAGIAAATTPEPSRSTHTAVTIIPDAQSSAEAQNHPSVKSELQDLLLLRKPQHVREPDGGKHHSSSTKASRSSVVKIEIPPLLETGGCQPEMPVTNGPPAVHVSSPGAGRSDVRRRKSLAKPLPESTAALNRSSSSPRQDKSGENQRESTNNTRSAAACRNPASVLYTTSAHMTSAFLRRKQSYLNNHNASPAMPPPASGAASNPSSKQQKLPTRLFFQDPSEPEPSRGALSPASTGGDLETDTDTEDESTTIKKHNKTAIRHPPGSDNNTLERIGELSREEDEFDFAILLKPSKYEEHLEIPLEKEHLDVGMATTATSERATETESHGKPGSIHQPADDAPPPSTFVFASPVASKAHLLGKAQQDPTRARNLIIDRIKHTGLQVKRLLSLDGKQTLLKVKAPQQVLEMGAEQMKMRKLRRFDQIWMEFSCELRATFADYDDDLQRVRFLDSEKQSIVHSLLTSSEGIGAGLNEFCPLKTKYVVKMFPLHKQDLTALKRHWVTFWRPPRNADDGHNRSSKSSSRHIQADALPITASPPPGASGATAAVASSSTACGRSPRRVHPHASCCHRLTCDALSQPIDDVAQYFGEKVAFYFAWMEMYTRWLLVPSIVGLILFCLQVASKQIDHPVAPLYAVFMAVWTSAFLIAWKRRASTLAYRWGTLGYEDVETTRPEFYGDPAVSTLSQKKYPAWRRYLKYLVTMPTVLLSMVLTVTITYFAFSTRDRLEAQSLATKAKAQNLAKDIVASDLQHGLTLENFKRLSSLGLDWQFWFYFLITPMLYGLLIPVLDYLFTKCARRMNNWENHKTETQYRSHLILKVFSFRFVHVFASLYYYAFANVSSSSSSAGSGSQDNLLRVAIQLASFMVAGQLWKNVMETLYPFFKRKWQLQQKKQATNAQFSQSTVFNVNNHHHHNAGSSATQHHRQRHRRDVLVLGEGSRRSDMLTGIEMSNNNAVIHEQCVRLEQASDKAWEEAELEPYDTFEDYTEMLIQFGYVSFFSLAFPLAPLLALVNNVVELRTDAFKLCHAKQRPIAHKASGIGIWFQVLQLMSVLAVLTNCLHIAFTTTLVDSVVPGDAQGSTATKVWVAFGVEHFLLALKLWMMFVIPSMPKDVQDKVRVEREHAKQESARAMVAKLLLQSAATAEEDVSMTEHAESRRRRHLPVVATTTSTSPGCS